jgi:hypothetical protein
MFLGWKVSWSSDSGAEGYWLKYRLGDGFYSIPIYVPHIGVPSYEQAYVFPWCLTNQFYTFAVQPVNGLFASQTWGDISTLTTFVEDNQAPDPPATDTMDIDPGFWSNTLTWAAPSGDKNQDILQFIIYRNQNDDNPDNAVPYGTAGYQKVVAWVDPFGGDVDFKDNRYWITSVDHSNNESAKSTMLKESEPPAVATATGINLFWLILVWWSVNKGDESYKVYRSHDVVAKGGFEVDDDKNLLLDGYKPSFLVDTGTAAARAATKPPFLLPAPVALTEYYYKVVAKTFNSHFAIPSAATGGVTPVIPGDDDLPPRSMSKLLLDYEEIQIGVGIDAGTVNITGRLVELEAQTINLDATGNINISAGKAININGGRINITSEQGLYIQDGGDIFFDSGAIRSSGSILNIGSSNDSNTFQIGFGQNGLGWNRVKIDAKNYMDFACGGAMTFTPSNLAVSQMFMSLPKVPHGITEKKKCRLYVDRDNNVKAYWLESW